MGSDGSTVVLGKERRNELQGLSLGYVERAKVTRLWAWPLKSSYDSLVKGCKRMSKDVDLQ